MKTSTNINSNADKFTVKQIKDCAATNNIKVPSGLTKDLLISYILGITKERENGVIKEKQPMKISLDKLNAVYVDDTIDWYRHLCEYGWATVPIDGWKSTFTNTFMTWMEGCSTDFSKDDPATWKLSNMPANSHNVFKNYFGHTEMQWQIRELCIPIFSHMWQCQPEDLLCSFDGGCFIPPCKATTFKPWIHVDQPRFETRFSCVQGIVNFEDNGPNDGGLVLVENSHTVFDEYMNRNASEGIVWQLSNLADPLLSDKRLIKVCAPAGSMILFDSRTFHCNVKPSGDNYRMCTYVSMQPREYATPKELQTRIKLYENGRMTGHWCYGHYFKGNPEHPYTRGGINNMPKQIEVARLNDLRSRLVGY